MKKKPLHMGIIFRTEEAMGVQNFKTMNISSNSTPN